MAHRFDRINPWGGQRRPAARLRTPFVTASVAPFAAGNRRLERECAELRERCKAVDEAIGELDDECAALRASPARFDAPARRLRSELARMNADVERIAEQTETRAAELAARERLAAAEVLMSLADELAGALREAESKQAESDHVDVFAEMAAAIDAHLERVGFRRIETIGAEMDPQRHEALVTMPAPPEQSGRIMFEIAAGYEDVNTTRIVRAAQVVVGQ